MFKVIETLCVNDYCVIYNNKGKGFALQPYSNFGQFIYGLTKLHFHNHNMVLSFFSSIEAGPALLRYVYFNSLGS